MDFWSYRLGMAFKIRDAWNCIGFVKCLKNNRCPVFDKDLTENGQDRIFRSHTQDDKLNKTHVQVCEFDERICSVSLRGIYRKAAAIASVIG